MAAATGRWRDRARLLLLLCCGFGVALQLGRTPASLPLLRDQFSLGLAAAGWLVSSVSLLSALAGLPAGLFAIRIGLHRAVVAGLGLAALGCAIGLLANGPPGLIGGRIIEGAGFIITVTAVPPLLMRVAGPARAPTVMAVWGTYLPGGMALMMALSPGLLDVGGWKLPLAVNLGLLCLALAGFGLVFGSEAPSAGGADPRSARALAGALVAQRTPLYLGAVFVLYAAQFLAVMAFLPLVFQEIGWPPALALYVTAGIVALNGVGNVCGGLLLRHGLARSTLLTVAIVLMGIAGAITLFPALPPMARLVGAGGMALCGGAIPATLLAAVPGLGLEPAERTACVGLLLQCAGIGQLLGPPAFGAVVTASGWGGAAILTLLLSAGAAACVAAMGRSPATA